MISGFMQADKNKKELEKRLPCKFFNNGSRGQEEAAVHNE